jgi:hypothetical protein
LSNGYLTVCVLTEAPKGYKVSAQMLWAHHGRITVCLFSYISDPSCVYMIVDAGTRTKRFGQLARALPLGRHLLRGRPRLGVAHRQRVVIRACREFLLSDSPLRCVDCNRAPSSIWIIFRRRFHFATAHISHEFKTRWSVQFHGLYCRVISLMCFFCTSLSPVLLTKHVSSSSGCKQMKRKAWNALFWWGTKTMLI